MRNVYACPNIMFEMPHPNVTERYVTTHYVRKCHSHPRGWFDTSVLRLSPTHIRNAWILYK